MLQVLQLSFKIKPQSVIIQKKSISSFYFPVVLFVMPRKIVFSFAVLYKMLFEKFQTDHSNKSF